MLERPPADCLPDMFTKDRAENLTFIMPSILTLTLIYYSINELMYG